MDSCTSETKLSDSSLEEIISNYSIDMSTDMCYQNKLVNIDNDDREIFMMKNDFYSKHGSLKFNMLNQVYSHEVHQIDIKRLKREIMKKCTDLLEKHKKDDDTKKGCFFFCKANKKEETNNFDALFVFFYNLHLKSIKIKIWKDVVRDFDF